MLHGSNKITLQCIILLWLGPAIVYSFALGDITEKVNPPAAVCGHGTHTQMLYMGHVGHIWHFQQYCGIRM